MGDLLRRILYPLVLPAIVVSVWANAWATKVDRQAYVPIPPVSLPASVMRQIPSDAPVLNRTEATEYGLSRDDAFASTTDEDAE